MKKTKEVYELPVEEIVVLEDRFRKEFDPRKIRELAMSFSKRGQLQAGVCRKVDDKIVLIAGERRLRACQLLGINYHFTLSEVGDDNAYEIKKIELEENLCRLNLSWQEEVQGTEELHLLEQKEKGSTKPGVRGGHGVKDTAETIGESVGTVSENLRLAIYARNSEEVRGAKSKSEAKKIIKRLEEKLDRFERLEKALNIEEKEGGEKEEVTTKSQMIYFSKRIHLGKMEERIQEYEDGYFDVVCFDPPWRVGVDSVRKKGGGTDDFEDAVVVVKNFIEELKIWLDLLYKKMAVNSHLYMFFGIAKEAEEEEDLFLLGPVYSTVESAGFTTNKIPLIWHKQGAHVVRTPDVWPGRSYEPIAFARKGSKNLIRKGAPDVITTPAPTPSMKKNHPTAKHPLIYLELLQRSCLPGDKVLDPMCGSGMMGVAAEALEPSLKLNWEMIEEIPDFRRLSIINVVEGFSNITQRKEPEVPLETPYSDKLDKIVEGDFRKLEVGSTEWKYYWNQYPEKQEEMLSWRKKNN